MDPLHSLLSWNLKIPPLLEKEKHLHKPPIFGVPAVRFRGKKRLISLRRIIVARWIVTWDEIIPVTHRPNWHHDWLVQWNIWISSTLPSSHGGVQRVGFLERSWKSSFTIVGCLCCVSLSYGSQQRLLLSSVDFLLHHERCLLEVSRMRRPRLVWKVLKIECTTFLWCEYPPSDADPISIQSSFHPHSCHKHILQSKSLTSTGLKMSSSNLPQQSHQLHNAPSTLLLPD